ncbi:MAG: leucine-rich repeat protein [Clostridia bacterium]|nr:leucine-rich repeat protein [Clostridia bacterium]
MKGKNVFTALDAVKPSYLEEAENARPRMSAARILSILLPAAAMALLIAATAMIFIPLGAPAPFAEQAADPAAAPTPEAALETVAIPTPEVRSDENGLVYALFGDHVEIRGYLGSEEEIVLPEKIGGSFVTHLILSEMEADRVSRVCYNGGELEKLTLPEDRKVEFHIGPDVRSVNAGLLHSPYIRSVTVDEDNPVYADYGGMLYTKDMRTLILCPAGAGAKELYYEATAEYADDPAVALFSIKLQTVATDAFKDCQIERIVLPPSLTNVERGSFRNCGKLVSVSLPGSVRYLSGEAFDGCSSLDVQFEGTEEEFNALHVDLPANVRVYCRAEDDV